MVQCPKCKKDIPFLVDKKTALYYSVYLAIGSVSFFVFLTAVYTTYLGFIWSYSVRYMVNAITLILVLLITSILLLLAGFRLLQAKHSASVFGFAGIGFLLIYSLFVLLIDPYISATLSYMLLLVVAVIIVVILTIMFWKRTTSKKSLKTD